MDEDDKFEKIIILGICVTLLVCGLLYAAGYGLIHAGLSADFLWALGGIVFYRISKFIYCKIRDDEWLI